VAKSKKLVKKDADTGLPSIIVDGEPKLLARLPDTNDHRPFLRLSDVRPIVPESEWKEIDRRQVFAPSWILNQRSHGSCVGFAAAGSLMRARAIGGQGEHRLSGAFVYSYINGGRDQGAMIGDAVSVLLTHGCALEFEVGWDQIYPNQITPEARHTAKRFRALECYTVESWEEACSAVQLGYVLSYPVMVGNTFTRVDAEGVCGYDRGPGNHAVCADGMKRSDKWGWTLDMPNSWGQTFGENGRGRTAEKHWEGVQVDAYALRCAATDPEGDNPPPANP
jgi:hypothetical protein